MIWLLFWVGSQRQYHDMVTILGQFSKTVYLYDYYSGSVLKDCIFIWLLFWVGSQRQYNDIVTILGRFTKTVYSYGYYSG